jgi:DNA-binding HxlR family transcriptional regulator
MIDIKNNRSNCPISTTLEIVGDHWSLIIIRDLFFERTTFSEFRNSPEKIASNILTNRLKKLLEYNLIGYILNPNNKKVKIYYLNDSGIDLYPIIFGLLIWGKKHINMNFLPLSIDWYKEADGKTLSEINNEWAFKYRNFRKIILEKMTA